MTGVSKLCLGFFYASQDVHFEFFNIFLVVQCNSNIFSRTVQFKSAIFCTWAEARLEKNLATTNTVVKGVIEKKIML